MNRTIHDLREAGGESRSDLAEALGITRDEVGARDLGQTEPTISRLRALTQQFGVRDNRIELGPEHPPSVADRQAELF